MVMVRGISAGAKNSAVKRSAEYFYFINQNERGCFYADVRDEGGKTVFEVKAGDLLGEDESSIFEDGFMTHNKDLDGLHEYLVDLGIIGDQSRLLLGQ